eukprot:4253520-Heterocapsa_arctica.AAC.1
MRAKQFCQRRPIGQLRGGGVFEEVEDVVLETCTHQSHRGMRALQARDVSRCACLSRRPRNSPS